MSIAELDANPLVRLARLLQCHQLPDRLKYDTHSTSPTTISDATRRFIRPCSLHSPRGENGVLSRIHKFLSRYAPILAPNHDAQPGTVSASIKETRASMTMLENVSEGSRIAAEKRWFSAELGESHFLEGALTNPLNTLLDRTLAHTGIKVYWRFVSGPDGRPDIELVVDRGNGITPRLERLVVVKIKTVDALPTIQMRSLLNDLESGHVSLSQVANGGVESSRLFSRNDLWTSRVGERPAFIKVAEQVGDICHCASFIEVSN